MRSTKIKTLRGSSLWTCLHHMVILRSQNKITDFLMILAWASPFNMICNGYSCECDMGNTAFVLPMNNV